MFNLMSSLGTRILNRHRDSTETKKINIRVTLANDKREGNISILTTVDDVDVVFDKDNAPKKRRKWYRRKELEKLML